MIETANAMSDSFSRAAYPHVPVLLNEVVRAFDFGRPAFVVDGTLGLGGHSEALLAAYPEMTIVGLEWDATALETARGRLSVFGDRFTGQLSNYADIPSVLSSMNIAGVDGLLLDLGLSSLQLQDPGRGFSFLREGPLDMRMSQLLRKTAWDWLVQSSEEELAALFKAYGEEPHARRIAAVLKDRLRTGQLANDAWSVAETIRLAAPSHGRADAATQCFQALRIAVNRELDNIDATLDMLPTLLKTGGRAAIISFHSLEDRRVKRAFQLAAKGCVCPPQVPQCMCGREPWGRLTPRRAIQAGEAEVMNNPRARSARLRVLERL